MFHRCCIITLHQPKYNLFIPIPSMVAYILIRLVDHHAPQTTVWDWRCSVLLVLPLLRGPCHRDVRLTVTVAIAAVKSYLPLPEISKILPVKIR